MGKLLVTIVGAHGLKGEDIIGDIDPYVKVTVPGEDSQRSSTAGKDDAANPVWNAVFSFEVSDDAAASGQVTIAVFDEDMFSDDSLGAARVELRSLTAGKEWEEAALPLLVEGKPSSPSPSPSTVHVRLEAVDFGRAAGEGPGAAEPSAAAAASSDGGGGGGGAEETANYDTEFESPDASPLRGAAKGSGSDRAASEKAGSDKAESERKSSEKEGSQEGKEIASPESPPASPSYDKDSEKDSDKDSEKDSDHHSDHAASEGQPPPVKSPSRKPPPRQPHGRPPRQAAAAAAHKPPPKHKVSSAQRMRATVANVRYPGQRDLDVNEILDPSKPLVKSTAALTKPCGPAFAEHSSAEERKRRRLESKLADASASGAINEQRDNERKYLKAQQEFEREKRLAERAIYQRERVSQWASRLAASPLAVDLVADHERIDEENMIRGREERRRQSLAERRRRKVKSEIVVKALAEVPLLDEARRQKREMLEEERREKALRDVQRVEAIQERKIQDIQQMDSVRRAKLDQRLMGH